jgi:hypothetical protein
MMSCSRRESFDVIHIIVGDDNNLPFSSGCTLGKADDKEFVILEVGEFLAAKQTRRARRRFCVALKRRVVLAETELH